MLIENVLKILDQNTPVVGIETMRKLVEVFDIIKNEGSVQQAAVNREGDNTEFVNPEFVPEATPQYVGEGEVMYNAEDEEEHICLTEDCDSESCDGPTVVDVEADEIREVE